MEYTYSLLSEEQLLGDNKSGVIEAIGTQCTPTDFAILTGAKPAGNGNCKWFLSSASGYGDIGIVNEDGEKRIAYATSLGSLRPVMICRNISELDCETTKDLSGFAEVRFGEYPQKAVSKALSSELERDFASCRLRKTGKRYDVQYEEYQRDGSKYIRATSTSGKSVWIEVAPVKWLFDEDAGMLISKTILISGIQFSSDNNYDGDFAKTPINRYLNSTFAEDIKPSVLRDMTPEEKAQYEADIARAARRRNPYGFTFGNASEEDIIRGAIESDVAVFLHGPSSEGKSARVKQIDPTCEIIYLRNATPDSLNGRSVYNQSTGEMIDIPPTWFRKVQAKCEEEPDRLHVVFFDEINNALPSIQGMAFNIVLDREVNGLWKLPANARVVAAGNDTQDSLAAHQLAAPFFNRFAHVYINTTTEKWLKWAKEFEIHPAIYAFIACKNGEPLRSPFDGEKPNADPRKWELASKMLYATGRPEMLRSLVGEEIADEFVQFCNQPVLTLKDVLEGNYCDEDIDEMNTSERYATTVGLTQAEESDFDVVRDFVSKLGEEFRAVFDSFTMPGEDR